MTPCVGWAVLHNYGAGGGGTPNGTVDHLPHRPTLEHHVDRSRVGHDERHQGMGRLESGTAPPTGRIGALDGKDFGGVEVYHWREAAGGHLHRRDRARTRAGGPGQRERFGGWPITTLARWLVVVG